MRAIKNCFVVRGLPTPGIVHAYIVYALKIHFNTNL
jgi:hypothetical protein